MNKIEKRLNNIELQMEQIALVLKSLIELNSDQVETTKEFYSLVEKTVNQSLLNTQLSTEPINIESESKVDN